ncbi:MAG: FAD-linked oxidase C-terminal domain-containing protein [Chloroflexota bacterium]
MPSLSLSELVHLFQSAGIQMRTDRTTRILYSTDASIYQVEPLGVAFPRTKDELVAIAELANRHNIPLLPRGSGSSLAGQAVGEALILDLTRYLQNIVYLNPEARVACVEPGVILNALNHSAAARGLQFAPDPASAERATMGGVIGNNSAGAHSICYGMAVDHLLSAEVVLSDGSVAVFQEVTLEEAQHRASLRGIEAHIYRTALDIRQQHADTIRKHWPRTWRRSSGYNLNYLLPWSPSGPPRWELDGLPYPPVAPGHLNLAHLLAGSEGTLGIVSQATVRLVTLPRFQVLGLLEFASVAEACDAVPEILAYQPSSIELIPRSMIQLARTVPAYARRITFLRGDPEVLLVVEFTGDTLSKLKEGAKRLGEQALIIEEASKQAEIWEVRKVGLGLLLSRTGDFKPIAFIEDVAVPVEQLGDYVRALQRILAEHNTEWEVYAHASAGCLHIRPLVNLKSAAGVQALRSIAEAAVELTRRMGGAMSGEHGDGLARSEWTEKAFGNEVYDLFCKLKRAADPSGILNPGKIVEGLKMDANLRYGTAYKAKGWQASLNFRSQVDLPGAIEMCNGAAVCRKQSGVMCPSFQITKEEMYSTRGRANLLRAMISSREREEITKAAYQALDLCLECKGCKAECPSSVDMAKLKVDFLHDYYRHRRRPVRDYLFAYFAVFAKVGSLVWPLTNWMMRRQPVRRVGEGLLGISARRPLPKLRLLRNVNGREKPKERGEVEGGCEEVLLLCDPFTRFFYPEVEAAAMEVLTAAGCKVHRIPLLGAGRTFISKGFLPQAKRQARRVVQAIARLDPQGRMPVLSTEPSEIFTLKDEYLDFFPDQEEVAELSQRAWGIEEFLVRPGPDGRPRILRIDVKNGGQNVLFHGHCYQKAQPPLADGYPVGEGAAIALLQAAGVTVRLIDSGCCGMAGAFGYEAEHYDLSMRIGEQRLFPAVRAAGENEVIAASGASCRSQIEHGTGKKAFHPLQIVAQALTKKS